MHMRVTFGLIIGACLFAPGTVLAQHGGDVGLVLDAGVIVTGEFDGVDHEPRRVFESEFGEVFPDFTDEPGFDTLHPGPFTPGTNIGFNIIDSLRKWNGSDFDTIPIETISITFGPTGPVTTPASPMTVAGFTLPVQADGGWHRHLEFTLNSPASTGIYSLQLELFSTQVGVGNSLPFWIVFNQNDTEENHEAAVAFVEQSLVPEPAGVGVVMMMGLGAMLMRRRRREA